MGASFGCFEGPHSPRYAAFADTIKRPFQLEENLQRKDLSAIERSKVMVQLKQTAQQVAKERPPPKDFRSDTGRKSRGRPAAQESTRAIAKHTGIPAATMKLAEEHLAVVERYPLLGSPDASQTQALTLAKVLAPP